jgi:hypothetical protein
VFWEVFANARLPYDDLNNTQVKAAMKSKTLQLKRLPVLARRVCVASLSMSIYLSSSSFVSFVISIRLAPACSHAHDHFHLFV